MSQQIRRKSALVSQAGGLAWRPWRCCPPHQGDSRRAGQPAPGGEMGLAAELQQEDPPRLVRAERLDLPHLPVEEMPIQFLGAQLRFCPTVANVGDLFDLLWDPPLQRLGKKPLHEAALVLDALDGLLNLLRGNHQLNSIQAFSAGRTPSGAWTLFRYVFLMCRSTLARTSESVSFATEQERGVSGRQRVTSR